MAKKLYKKIAILTLSALVMAFVALPPSTSSARAQDSSSGKRKIVIFKSEVTKGERDADVRRHGGIKLKDLDLVDGVAVVISDDRAKALEKDTDVLRVEDDLVVEALDKGSGKNPPPAPAPAPAPAPSQVLPWGIDRIDAELVWGTTTADSIRVAVIDTGIELTHPDLAANIKGGINAIRLDKSPNDDNGHGTHVAGTIAALNNTIGVVGAGPNIDLYAVKVLNKNGSGFLSDIIEGLDWSIASGMNVVNMSLGTASFSAAFQAAVQRVNAAGIVQVAAAGNSGPTSNTVIYPAKFAEVIAVSATDINNNLASFSSRGPEVDLAAPGVSIFSTYRGQTYRTLSGTSMASPHVAGAAALLLSVPAKCDADLSGTCSPAEVQARLEATATDLGAAGKDSLFGSGIVDANAAVNN